VRGRARACDADLLPAEVGDLLELGLRHQREDHSIRRAHDQRQVAALEIRLDFVEPVHEREADLAGEDRLDPARARRDVDQLHIVEAVLREKLLLLRHVEPALRAGDGGPVDADFLLLRPGGRREHEDQEDEDGEKSVRFHACPV
jgi:hypothetical protein